MILTKFKHSKYNFWFYISDMKTISIFILLIYWSIMIFAPVMSKDIMFNRAKINNIKLVYMSLIIDKNYTCDKYIDYKLIYNNFNLFEDNVNVNEKYITMVYENKNKNVLDEPPD